jgi:hypothetical protein
VWRAYSFAELYALLADSQTAYFSVAYVRNKNPINDPLRLYPLATQLNINKTTIPLRNLPDTASIFSKV